jgi:hypothetical protein
MSGKSRTYNFTDRKKTFGNFWLVYSNKTGVVVKLKSDREIAHWALNLEFNPDVRSFQFDDFVEPGNESVSLREIRYRVLAHYFNGLEYHRVSVIKTDAALHDEQRIDAILWKTRHIKFRHICDEDLKPRSNTVFALLRLSAYLTATKDQFITSAVCDEVSKYFREINSGSISKYLVDMKCFSEQVLMVYIYRLYNRGHIVLHYQDSPFSYDTIWEISRHGLD